MKIETRFERIKGMPDSNLKLIKIINLGLQFGIFNKQPILDEMNRLLSLGYTVSGD